MLFLILNKASFESIVAFLMNDFFSHFNIFNFNKYHPTLKLFLIKLYSLSSWCSSLLIDLH